MQVRVRCGVAVQSGTFGVSDRGIYLCGGDGVNERV